MYELADQSWRQRSVNMSRKTLAATAARIAEHARTHRLPSVQVVLHGGEPLLVGSDMLDYTARTLRAAVRSDTDVDLRIQTNGTLLNEEILRILSRHRIRVGVSLDGDDDANDRHRRYRNGQGSYQAVSRGLELLNQSQFRELFSGLLCTIDVRNDPIAAYEGLAAFEPPIIDFLLPHGNWTERPPNLPDGAGTPYADWLITIFDKWYESPPPRPGIRTFQSLIGLLLKRPASSETFGVEPVTLVVIETDGELQQVDSLKSAFQGAPSTNLNVRDNPLDDALEHPAIVARQLGVEGLADTCQACRFRDVCGGGLYTHRYREGVGFLNPSVYCTDLMKLITHIHDRVLRDLVAARR